MKIRGFFVFILLIFGLLLNSAAVFAEENIGGDAQNFSLSFLGAYKRTMLRASEMLALCRKYNVDFNLALSIAMYESGGHEDLTSSAGAKGIMQVMPDTMRFMRGKNSLDAGIKYLAYLDKNLKSFLTDRLGKDPEKSLLTSYVIMAYNGGPGAVKSKKIRVETMQYLQGVSLYYSLLTRDEYLIEKEARTLGIFTTQNALSWKNLASDLNLSIIELRLYNPFIAHREPVVVRKNRIIVYAISGKQKRDLIEIRKNGATEKFFYKIRLGDIFHYIANAFGFDYDAFRTKNNLLLWSPLQPGTKLEITDSDILVNIK